MNGQQYGSQFGSGMGAGITSSQGIATGASNVLKQMINTSVSSLGHDGQRAGSQFGTGVTSGVASHNGAVFNASSNLKASAHNGMSGGYNGGYNAGMAIGEGMMSGIYAMADRLQQQQPASQVARLRQLDLLWLSTRHQRSLEIKSVALSQKVWQLVLRSMATMLMIP